MKKIAVVLVLAAVALAVSVTGVAFAQSPQPPTPGAWRPVMSGSANLSAEGPLHDYMVSTMAGALGLTPSDFEARLEAGKTAYQIALDLGISADKIPSLLADARAEAIHAAAAAGILVQQQADRMTAGGLGTGVGLGTCTGTGSGWRWQQVNP